MTNPTTAPPRWLAIGAGLLTSTLALAAFGLAVTLAPPRSGPNCLTETCVDYPFTDIAAYAPVDYWWMLPAALLPIAYLVLLLALRAESLTGGQRVLADLAVLLTTSAATTLVTAYAIQWAVVQPSLLKGEEAALVLWSQYNPHGLFIALEDVGYLFLSMALLATVGLIVGTGRLARAARYVTGAFGLVGVLGLPVLVAVLGYDLEYQYEVLAIVAVWWGLILLGLLVTGLQWSDRRRRDA